VRRFNDILRQTLSAPNCGDAATLLFFPFMNVMFFRIAADGLPLDGGAQAARTENQRKCVIEDRRQLYF
jgi:hypothetical protein